MKTTIEISDELLRLAKQRSQRDGTTLRALVEDGLRRVLREQDKHPPQVLEPLVFKGDTGLMPEFADQDWARIKEETRRR